MKRKKRAITLIEIIIVIALISIIGSALAFNMRGSLDRGRLFKTEQNKQRIESALEMAVAESGEDPADVAKNWTTHLAKSPFIKSKEAIKDGWGGEFKVTYNKEDDCFSVTSKKYDDYKAKHGDAKK